MVAPVRWRSRLRGVRRACLLYSGILLSAIPLIADESPSPLRFTRPRRELELISGERLPVEDVRCDGKGLVFRWNGDNRSRLPLAVIRSVANLPGWLDCIEKSFDGTPTPWSHRCDPPLSAGELVFSWRQKPETTDSSNAVLRLAFGNGEADSDLELRLGHDGAVITNLPQGWRKTFSQSWSASADRSRVRIAWHDRRCEVQVGDAIHSVFTIPEFALRKIVLDPMTSSSMIIDDLSLREYRAELARMRIAPRATETLDRVTLDTGDQLFGQLAAARLPATIALEGEQGTWASDWSQAVRIDLSRRPIPAHCLAPINGWQLDLRPSSTRHLRNLCISERTAQHPWLGLFSLSPPNQGSHTGFGEFRWLEPDPRHLGDEIRSDLSPTVPVGTAVSGTIEFPELPRGRMWMMVDVAEMEPSGPETIPTQPFLDALRGGGLRTELLINDRIVTDVNRFLRVRTPATHPERVWLPIPNELWRAGINTWALRQRPLSSSQLQYDDAEVGRIALWITPF